jgi:hypothetical protein
MRGLGTNQPSSRAQLIDIAAGFTPVGTVGDPSTWTEHPFG